MVKQTLDGWLVWLQCPPIHQKISGFIPGQGTYLGGGFDDQSGWHIGGSSPFSLSLPAPLCLKINKNISW